MRNLPRLAFLVRTRLVLGWTESGGGSAKRGLILKYARRTGVLPYTGHATLTPNIPDAASAAYPRLASRLSARVLVTRFSGWSCGLGGHSSRVHSLCRHRWCAARHGSVHNRPATGRLCRIRHVPSARRRRAGGDLLFANISHLGEELKAAILVSRPPVKHVLLVADSVNFIDTSACDALSIMIQELQGQSITIAFARVRDAVREQMQLCGIEAAVGSTNFYERVTDGVHAWRRLESVPAASCTSPAQ